MVEPVNRAAMRRHASLGPLNNHIVAWCTIASVLVDAILAQTTAFILGIVAAASLWRANVDVRAQLLLFIGLELAVV